MTSQTSALSLEGRLGRGRGRGRDRWSHRRHCLLVDPEIAPAGWAAGPLQGPGTGQGPATAERPEPESLAQCKSQR